MRRPLHLGPVACLLLSLACTALACSSANESSPAGADPSADDPPGDDDDGADDDDDEPSHVRDAGKKDANAKDASSGGDASTSNLYASDPLNCGAKGHSCLGGTCADGICASEKIRDDASWLTIDTDGSLVTIQSAAYSATMRRGARTPYAPDTLLFTMSKAMPTTWVRFFRDGRLTATNGSPDRLEQWVGSGGQAATSTTLYAGRPRGVAIDDAHVFYGDSNYDIVRVDHGGGGKVALASSATLVPRDIALEGNTVYILSGDTAPFVKLFSVPAAGGAVTSIPFTDVAKLGADRLAVSPTHLVVSGSLTAQGKGLWAIWSVPKAGGTVTVLSAWSGLQSGDVLLTSGDYAYWPQRGAAGEKPKIMRRRVDGSDALVTIATSAQPTAFAFDAQFVYWASSNGAYRAPK